MLQLDRATPTLAAHSTGPCSWCVPAIVDALEVLLELGHLGGTIVLAWPEGKPLRPPIERDLGDLALAVASGTDWLELDVRLPIDEGWYSDFVNSSSSARARASSLSAMVASSRCPSTYAAASMRFATSGRSTASKPVACRSSSSTSSEAYLRCGILEHGIAHLACSRCGHSMIVTFSCKRRRFCPSRLPLVRAQLFAGLARSYQRLRTNSARSEARARMLNKPRPRSCRWSCPTITR